MKFIKLLTTASAMACCLNAPLAAAHDTDRDDGPKIVKTYDFTGFDRIHIEGVYEVDIQVGPNFSIETSGSEKQMNRAKVVKSGTQTLILGLNETGRLKRWKGHNNGIRAVITLPALNKIALTGVGSVEVSGIDAQVFDATLEGVGSIELAGKCGRLDANVEGVGSLEADDFECEDVNVSVEGMGSAEVYASKSVDADIEGMGSIDVEGSPKSVKKSKSFMSSISIN